MSKNQKRRSEWGDGVYITVKPANAALVRPGRPLALGADGLIGIPEGPVTTTDLQRLQKALASTRVGETVVNLPGIGQVRDMGAIPGSIAEFGKVYYDPATDALVADNTKTFIGYRYQNQILVRNN